MSVYRLQSGGQCRRQRCEVRRDAHPQRSERRPRHLSMSRATYTPGVTIATRKSASDSGSALLLFCRSSVVGRRSSPPSAPHLGKQQRQGLYLQAPHFRASFHINNRTAYDVRISISSQNFFSLSLFNLPECLLCILRSAAFRTTELCGSVINYQIVSARLVLPRPSNARNLLTIYYLPPYVKYSIFIAIYENPVIPSC